MEKKNRKGRIEKEEQWGVGIRKGIKRTRGGECEGREGVIKVKVRLGDE